MFFQKKSGFTLVEMAIVLVIIGLILGTLVLKGESLVANAKKKTLIGNFMEFQAAYYTFYDQYHQYPGDENDINGVPFPLGDTENGNGNGFIDGAENNNFGLYVWNDLAKAGIVTTRTSNPFGGEYGWTAINFHPTDAPGINLYRNTVYAMNIPADIARELDLQYDDGIWNTGDLMADANYLSATIVTLYWRV